jgi:23S rRNA-/tRNA-specific pseudouridylate synthase
MAPKLTLKLDVIFSSETLVTTRKVTGVRSHPGNGSDTFYGSAVNHLKDYRRYSTP